MHSSRVFEKDLPFFSYFLLVLLGFFFLFFFLSFCDSPQNVLNILEKMFKSLFLTFCFAAMVKLKEATEFISNCIGTF